MRNHDPPTVWAVPDEFRTIYSHAVEVPQGTRYLHVSGQLGVAADDAMRSGFARQLEQAMDNIEALLAAAGMGRSDVAKATFFLTRAEDLPALGEARRRRWASDAPPAVTVLVVAALARLAVYAEGDGVEWATPVLYLRAPDGRIFDVERTPAVEARLASAETGGAAPGAPGRDAPPAAERAAPQQGAEHEKRARAEAAARERAEQARAEEEEKRRWEGEEARLRAEREDAARWREERRRRRDQQAEQEAARKRAARQEAEEEARRRAEEEEDARRWEARRRAAEEKRRRAAEEDARRWEARRKAEEDARLCAEREDARRWMEEQRRRDLAAAAAFKTPKKVPWSPFASARAGQRHGPAEASTKSFGSRLKTLCKVVGSVVLFVFVLSLLGLR